MFFMACARRLPAKAADREAGRAGGNSESAQRTPRLTYSGGKFPDSNMPRNAPGSSLPRYGRAGSR